MWPVRGSNMPTLSEADCADGRMGEDDSRYVVVVQLEGGLVVEHAVGQTPTGCDGN